MKILIILIGLFFPAITLAALTYEDKLKLIELQLRIIEEIMMMIIELINKLAGY